MDPNDDQQPTGTPQTPPTPPPAAPTTQQPSATPATPPDGNGSEQDQAPTQEPQSLSLTPDGTVEKQSVPSRIYHGILSALGGSNDVQLARDPNTGKMVATTVAKTPGSQWKQIIGGALAGLAGSAGAGVGPGAKTRALGMGVGAGLQQDQQQQQKKVDAANQDYDEQQKTLVRKAQLQQMAVQTAAASFSLERAHDEAASFDAKQLNDHMQWLRDNGGTDLGTFKDFAAVADQAKNDPTLAADIAHGRVSVVPAKVDGKIVGIQVARVPEDWGNSMISQDMPIERMVPGKDGQPPTWKTETVPAGTMKNSAYNAAVLATVTQKAKLEQDRVEADWKRAQTAKENAATVTEGYTQQKLAADALKARAEAATEPAKRAELLAQATKAYAEADKAKDAPKNASEIRQFDDKWRMPATAVEKSWQMADEAYKEHQAAVASGKPLPSGAQSMQMLSQHIATTFGSVKGARITKDMIQAHLGARGVTDAAQVAIQRLRDGDGLSNAQWDAFHSMIAQSRQLSWEGVADEAARRGIDPGLPADLKADADHSQALKLGVPPDYKQLGKDPKTGAIVGYVDGSGNYHALAGGK